MNSEHILQRTIQNIEYVKKNPQITMKKTDTSIANLAKDPNIYRLQISFLSLRIAFFHSMFFDNLKF